MRILIVGDLMGARAHEAPPIDRRPIVSVAVDTFDEVFARFTPSVALPALGLKAPLRFEALEDFHPDRLFATVETFDRLRSLRQRLQHPATFAAAAEELKSDVPAPSPPTAVPAPAAGTEEKTGALLDRLLGGTSASSSASHVPNRAETTVDAYIRSLVAPYITADNEAQVRQLVSAVDAAIGDAMRSLLHDAAFQRLEATWRGVQWLLASAAEIEEDLQVFLLHLTREDLRVYARPGGTLEPRLEAGDPDGTPWSLILGDFAFGPSEDDVDALRNVAALATALETPFVAAAHGALVGCVDVRVQADPRSWTALPSDAAQRWTELRTMPGSRFLGLTWPRFLLRLPYGKKSDPLETFEFDEIPPAHAHEDYLWGNGAFAAALTMARIDAGATGHQAGEIGDLPAFTYVEHDEPTLKPSAEFGMTERAADDVIARGIMPLVSYRNRNALRLIRVQSIGGTALG